MKKLIIILIAILTLFILCACDITELSAPEDSDTTVQVTSEETTDTNIEETTDGTNTTEPHLECEYCGKLEGNDRWFIAKVTEDLMVMPMGTDCFEAKASLGAGIYLSYKEVDGNPDVKLKAGDVIKVEYNGMIMESYPVQISADKVSVIYYLTPTLNEELKEYSANYGGIPVKSGDTIIYPIRGYVGSEETFYDKTTGEKHVLCSDGLGLYEYLRYILSDGVTDELTPTLTLDGSINIITQYDIFDIKYIDFSDAKKEMVKCSPEDINSLPSGQYYIIFDIISKLGDSWWYDEYIFKLVVN